MTTALVIEWIIFLSLLIALSYLLVRNHYVIKFLERLIDDAYDWKIDPDNFFKYMNKTKSITDKYDYNQFLFSVKPLTYEAWFTEDEVRFLKEHTL